MLVYGDRLEARCPSELLADIQARIAMLPAMAAGIARHAKLVAALVETGQLLQGIEDRGLACAELHSFIHRLAGCVIRSYDSSYERTGKLPSVPRTLLPPTAELRVPEGFAFYALYPEAYVEAARKLKLKGPPRVIGIRSIGTTLGAIVAAGLGAEPATNVRPFGHPFAREAELSEDLVEREAHYVIVDEGPGLSGSSFGCIADWLEDRGVPLDRIAFICGHSSGPGREASERHRLRWQRAQRHAAELDTRFLERQFGRLDKLRIGTPWERCKFLAQRDSKAVLLKFAGLGAIGEHKLAMARALHASGFTPEPLGLVHGFLAERWLADATPLLPSDKPLDEIGRYIGARARLFPAKEGTGASIDELLAMCRRNLSLAFDERSAEIVGRWNKAELAKSVRRTRTDNKLDKIEWLRLPGGGLIKCDALDHHQSHDLIGCQGFEWDVAGAIIEFALSPSEASHLVDASALPVDRSLLQFYLLAYAAFRLGQAELGGLADRSNYYAAQLKHLLHEDFCPADAAQVLV